MPVTCAFPLNHNTLKPLRKGWQEYSTDDVEQHQKWATEGVTAWGVDTGKSGLLVVDCDMKHGVDGIANFAKMCAEHNYVLNTYAVKTKSGGVHHYFTGTGRTTAGAIAPGVDTRGVGGYVVAPPTPGYEIVNLVPAQPLPDWLAELLPVKVKREREKNDDLSAQDKDHPTDVEYCQKYLDNLPPPVEGQRDNVLYKATCVIRDHKVSREIALELMQGYHDKHGLEQKMDAIVNHVYEYAQNSFGNSSVTEFDVYEPPTQTIAAPSQIRQVSEENRPKENREVIEELNREWAITSSQGKVKIQRLETDLATKQKHYYPYSLADLKIHLADKKVETQVSQEKTKIMKLADYWIESPYRNFFPKGTIFDPSNTCGPEYLNLFQGWAVQPKQGDWSLLRNHIFENVVKRNEEHFWYLMKYMGHMFQRPNDLPGVAVILIGGKGVGKSIVGDQLKLMIGAHARSGPGGRALTGQFNAALQDTVFYLINELDWAGYKEGTEILKDRITSPTLAIEPKGCEIYECPNFLRIFITSNSNWVVQATYDERRYCIFNVDDARQGDNQYWDTVWDQMDHGGREAMLYDLLNLDLGNWHPRKGIPKTEALVEQQRATWRLEEHFLHWLLNQGELPSTWCSHACDSRDWWNNDIEILSSEMHKTYDTLFNKPGEGIRKLSRFLVQKGFATRDRNMMVTLEGGNRERPLRLTRASHTMYDPYRD